ncbi:inactive serine protease scarface [Lasioglossum baleicum]|uniref:inactive serine protease scarface n=1 Tax=Lasioglossum baleicum TaxID=434251 RepID=UPI003FCC2F06
MKKMLVNLLILAVTILSSNAFPSPGDYEQSALQVPVDQQFIQQVPVDQQQFIQQTANADYFDFDDSKSTQFLEQTSDFTISCSGQDRVCVKKGSCLNGYISLANNDLLANKGRDCRIQDEVCCQAIVEVQVGSHEIDQDFVGHSQSPGFVKIPPVTRPAIEVQPTPQIPTNIGIGVPTHVQLGCAAALLCVEEQFCTVDGTVSAEQVHLTSRQVLQRVPLSPCKHPETGIIGKCCRDPNYVDPWPAGNLPANYSGGFDEQGFPTFLNIAKVRPPVTKVPVPVPVPIQTTPRVVIIQQRPTPAPEEQVIHTDNSDIFSQALVPPPEILPENGDVVDSTNVVETKEKCGVRHKNLGTSDSRTVFGEIPWQAMVLQSKNRNILCSGALVSTHDVLTAANCIDNMSADDVSIKLGEWKLGYDLKHEEPLPFEILNVSSISMHPGYTKGYGEHDLAILHLETPAILDHHVNPLCLPQTNQWTEKKSCIATGWGKSILQAHYTGAIMHAVDMSILPTNLCKEQLTAAAVNPDAANGIICTTPKQDINNVCEADVGGPLACQNEEGFYELSGIYSQDTGCQSSNQVGIFAPLDNKWMTETMLTNNFRESTLFEDNQYLPPN